MEKNFKRTTVTSALPYANGPVHIGHLAGVYVPVSYTHLRAHEAVHRPKHTTNWLQTSSRSYTKKESLSKKLRNNIMMKKHTSFWPTATSPVNVLTVIRKVPMVTNAKSAELHCRPLTWLIRKVPSAEANRSWKKPNTGIFLSTNTKHGCANGFWKITKNGVRTYTVNAKAGSTWVCNHVPWAVTLIGVSLFP